MSHHCTLEGCLTKHFSVGEPFKDNYGDWRTLKYTLKSVPPIAMLTLNFRKDYYKFQGNYVAQKNLQKLKFEEELEWSGMNHRLHGVICHSGPDVEYGHYTCFVRHHDNWFFHNDEKCTQTCFTALKNLVKGGDEYTSYTLLYVNHEWTEARSSGC